jgi:hypothetical protein
VIALAEEKAVTGLHRAEQFKGAGQVVERHIDQVAGQHDQVGLEAIG